MKPATSWILSVEIEDSHAQCWTEGLVKKENTMKELMKNVVYAGVGAAFLTKEKIEELRNDMIEKGKLSQEEGRQFVDELIRKSDKAKDQLDLWMNRRVEEQVKKLNLATVDEVEELRRQVEELQVALNKRQDEE